MISFKYVAGVSDVSTLPYFFTERAVFYLSGQTADPFTGEKTLTLLSSDDMVVFASLPRVREACLLQ